MYKPSHIHHHQSTQGVRSNHQNLFQNVKVIINQFLLITINRFWWVRIYLSP